jgi:hypothetical protein
MWKLAGVALAAAAIATAPVAGAAPNSNSDGANQHAHDNGLNVAGATGNGPSGVLSAVQGITPGQAQTGLGIAAGHVPAP